MYSGRLHNLLCPRAASHGAKVGIECVGWTMGSCAGHAASIVFGGAGDSCKATHRTPGTLCADLHNVGRTTPSSFIASWWTFGVAGWTGQAAPVSSPSAGSYLYLCSSTRWSAGHAQWVGKIRALARKVVPMQGAVFCNRARNAGQSVGCGFSCASVVGSILSRRTGAGLAFRCVVAR